MSDLIARSIQRLCDRGRPLRRAQQRLLASLLGCVPDGKDDRERRARAHLALVPRLIPVFSHRYLTAEPQFTPSPVFSVYQADVVVYGDNLLDYVAHEFGVPPLHPSDRTYVPFWSDLAGGAESRDL